MVRETMERIPWERERLSELADQLDRWSARRVVEDAGALIRTPRGIAALLDERPVSRAIDHVDEVVRRDAADSVTLNGTRFDPRGKKKNEVVLVQLEKLEPRFKRAATYRPPGQHDRKALKYGDLLDMNEPAPMLKMRDPTDFTQGAKIAALRDRGYKVVPVEVAPDQAAAVRKAYGATAPQRGAIAAQAGAQMIDGRSWAEGIIGRGRSLERAAFADLEDAVKYGLSRGQENEQIERVLRRSFGVASHRARFVARDQLGTLNAQVTKNKHEAIGFQYYRWQTAGDERVRPEHKALDGKVRPWSKGHPTEGHPGDAPNCRCVALPATVDEWEEQQGRQRKPRGPAVAAAVVGVAALGLGALAARRVVRPVVQPIRPALPRRPATRVVPRTVEPMRPVQPADAPVTAPELPLPANQPFRPDQIRPAAQIPDPPENVLRFDPSPTAVAKRANQAMFRYAHDVTRSIMDAERAAGRDPGSYAGTFQLAVKAIRDSRSNEELREKLSQLYGGGALARLRRRAAGLKKPLDLRPKRRRNAP